MPAKIGPKTAERRRRHNYRRARKGEVRCPGCSHAFDKRRVVERGCCGTRVVFKRACSLGIGWAKNTTCDSVNAITKGEQS